MSAGFSHCYTKYPGILALQDREIECDRLDTVRVARVIRPLHTDAQRQETRGGSKGRGRALAASLGSVFTARNTACAGAARLGKGRGRAARWRAGTRSEMIFERHRGGSVRVSHRHIRLVRPSVNRKKYNKIRGLPGCNGIRVPPSASNKSVKISRRGASIPGGVMSPVPPAIWIDCPVHAARSIRAEPHHRARHFIGPCKSVLWRFPPARDRRAPPPR